MPLIILTITLSELLRALQSMKTGKSPGLDGLPPEFYLTFWSQLGPLLLEMINWSFLKGSFHQHSNTAIISLLLKKGKDPTDCSNYRPLSLLNTDIKLYAKVLASRLEAHMSYLIDPDQTGFIKTRLASDNIRRLIHIIENASKISSSAAILSLDAEKAFDRLEWSFLWSVLKIMGFGSQFIHMIKLLYTNPTAMVLTGQSISQPFKISRGSRQGCPLSPLLFAICLEPVAQAVRQSVHHKPIHMFNTSHFISLYADDILLYLEDVARSLPHLLSIFENFSLMSGYKVNWSKSATLPLNVAAQNESSILDIPTVNHLKYLGVLIYPSLSDIIKSNYGRMAADVEGDLKKWNLLPLTFHGRISIIKMNILPRVNFISSMLPLSPSKGFWEKLHLLAANFIWNNKKHRVKLSLLQKHKDNGGFNVPNFKLYHWSFVLRPLSQWLNPLSIVSWRSLEENIIVPHRIQDLIYANISPKDSQKFGSIISEMIKVWHNLNKHCNIQEQWFAHSPIFFNALLKIGDSPIFFPLWSNNGVHILSDICNSSGLRSFQDLQNWFSLPGSSFFFYLQLRTAMRTYGVPWNSLPVTHPLHLVLSKPFKCGSKIYHFLQKANEEISHAVSLWEKDISDNLNWKIIWQNIQLSSRNPNHQVIHYNFIHRTYFTPYKLFKMKVLPSPNCILCNSNSFGTFLHMTWECPNVKKILPKRLQSFNSFVD